MILLSTQILIVQLGIAYSKLSLTGSIVNADISSSAAIANSKLANSSVTVGTTSN